MPHAPPPPADLFIERERFAEALEFLERTRDESRLGVIRDQGVARGDTFLLLRAEKLSGIQIPGAIWKNAATQAMSLGRYYDAYRALLHAGDEEKAEAIRAEHMPDYEPFRPEGK